jgi:hypothetical protein
MMFVYFVITTYHVLCVFLFIFVSVYFYISVLFLHCLPVICLSAVVKHFDRWT